MYSRPKIDRRFEKEKDTGMQNSVEITIKKMNKNQYNNFESYVLALATIGQN